MADFANDGKSGLAVWLRMKQPKSSPPAMAPNNPEYPEQLKQGRRPHYIPDWATSAGMSQADLARAVGADKSNVSNWFSGTTPQEGWQKKLADLFDTTPEGLFRHPDEAWFAEFFSGRPRDEIDRMKATLSAAFPKKT